MSSPPDDDELHRAAILARRSRFVALALMGTTSAVSATACACLSPEYIEPDSGPDAGSSDSGAIDATVDSGASDSGPDDAGADDAAADSGAADSGAGDSGAEDSGGAP